MKCHFLYDIHLEKWSRGGLLFVCVRLCVCVALPRESSPFSENGCENIPQLLFVLKREKTNLTVGWAPALSALLKCCVFVWKCVCVV